MLEMLPSGVSLALSILALAYTALWLVVLAAVLLDRVRRRKSDLEP